MGDLGHRLDVDDDAAGIGQAFDEDGLGSVADGRLEIVRVVRIDEGAVPAQLLERQAELGQRTAIEIARGDEMVARLQQGEEGEELGGVAGGGGDRRAPAFQAGDAFLQDADGGVGQARIDVAEAVQVEQAGGVVGVLEHVGRGLVDGGGARARRRVGGGARVHRLGGEAEFLLFLVLLAGSLVALGARRFLGLVGDDAGIDAVPAQLAAQATEFDLGATIHHHLEAGGLGAGGGLVVADGKLHPHHLGADGDGLIGDRPGGGGIAEDVDHVHRLGDRGQIGIDGFPQQLLASQARIDRNDPITLFLQILGDEIAGPVPVGTGADHGDGAHGAQDLAQEVVGIVEAGGGHGANSCWSRGGGMVAAEDSAVKRKPCA